MANTDQIDKIITVRFRYSELMEGLAQIDRATGEIKSEMAVFKADMKDFHRQLKAGVITQAEYNQRMADYGNRMREDEQLLKALGNQRRQYTREVQANIKEETALDGSVNKLWASIAKLTAQYNNLSRAEREAAKGTAMRDEIKAMQVELNAANEGLLNFRDSVGNYGLAAKGFTPLTYQVQLLAREMPSLTVSAQQFFLAISNNLPMMADELTRAAKANKALRAEGKPTVSVLMQLVKSIFSWQTALVVAITLVTAFGKEIAAWVKGLFSGNSAIEEISASINTMNQSVDRGIMELRNEFDALKNAEKGTAEYAAAKKVIQDKYGSYLENQRNEIRNLDDLADAYELLKKKVIAATTAKGLEEANAKALKEYTESIEKTFKGVQEKFIAKFGEEQGVEFFTKFRAGINSGIPDLEKEAMRIMKEFDTTTYAQVTRNTRQGIVTQTVKKTYNPLTEVLNDMSNAQKRLDAVLDSNQIAMKTLSEMYKAEEEAVTDLVKAKQAEIEEARKMPGNTEEEVADRNRRIETLEAELTALQNLGKTAKDTARTTTQSARSTADEAVRYAQKAADEVYRLIQDLRDKTRDNEILNLQEDYDREVASVRARLEEIANLTDASSISERQSLNMKLVLMQEQLNRDIAAVNDKYRQEELDKEIEAAERENRARLAARQIPIAEAQGGVLDARSNGDAIEEAKAVIALRQAEAEAALQALMDIDVADADNSASEQERDLQRLQAINTLKDAEIGLADAVQRTIDLQRANAIRAAQEAGKMLGSFSSLFDALGGEGEKFAVFSKAFSVMQVALAQAVAIANVVAQGSAAPWFIRAITIASGIAAVLAAIAQATRQAESIKVPKYAQGGLVEGPGTGTSDSIPARLSNGEAVMTAQAVADWGPILSAFNVASGGNAIAPRNLPERNDGMKGLKQMLKEAFEEMPPQYVAVTEINRVGRRVKVSENVARLGGKRSR